MTFRRLMLDNIRKAGGVTTVLSPLQKGLAAADGERDPYGLGFRLTGDLREDARRSQLVKRARALGIDPADPQGEGGSFLDKVPKPLAGAVRGLASALEPLQLPQDVLFAALAGSMDPDSTITQRLSKIQLRDYLPGGEAPARPASGEEIFRLMGFNEEVSKWAGIAADLTVDPLIFGSWLRVTGKVSRIEELVTLGNRFDHYTSPLGLAKETNRVLRRSESYSQFLDSRMERLVGALRNPDSVVFGIQRFGERATRLMDRVLPSDVMYRVRFGNEAGQQLFDAERKAIASGIRLSENARLMLQRAQVGVDGDQSRHILQLYVQALEAQPRAREMHLSNLSPYIRELTETEIYALARDQAGVGFVPLARDPETIQNPQLRTLLEDAQGSLRQLGDELPDELRRVLDGEAGQPGWNSRVDEAKARVREAVAREGQRGGLTAEGIEAAQRQASAAFDNYLKDTLTIDALLGYHLSGYEFVSNGFRSSVFELTGDLNLAQKLWLRWFGAGLTRGEEGIAQLREQSTGIKLTTEAQIQSDEMLRQMRNRQARLKAVEDRLAELEAIKRADAEAIAAPGLRRDAVVARTSEEIARQEARKAAYETRKANVAAYHEARREQIRRYADSDDVRFAEELAQVAGQQVESLVGGRDGLIPALSAYVNQVRDFMMNHVERGVIRSRGGQAVLSTLRRLEEQAAKYQKALTEVVTAELPSPQQMNRLLQAQRNIARSVEVHAQQWRRLESLKANADAITLRSAARPAPAPEAPLPERFTVYRMTMPRAYFEDYMDRFHGLDHLQPRVLKETKRHAVVEFSPAGWENLRGDINHYLDGGIAGDMMSTSDGGLFGLLSSIRATRKRLEQAEAVALEGEEALRAYHRQLVGEAAELDLSPSRASEAADLRREVERIERALSGQAPQAPQAAPKGREVPQEVSDITAQLAKDSLELQRMFSPDSHPGTAEAYAYADRVIEILKQRRATANIHAESGRREAAQATEYAQAVQHNIDDAAARIAAAREEASTARRVAREETQAARASVRARRAAEQATREAEGLPRPGSRADLLNVARSVDYQPRSMPQRTPALAYDGENPTMSDILAARIKRQLDASTDVRTSVRHEDLDYEALLEQPITFGELWDRVSGLQALNFGEYAQGLMNGHLRKAYGLFIDGDNFERYIDALTSGGVIVKNRVLDDSDFRQYLPGMAEEADLLTEYHRSLLQAGGGAIIRRDGMIRFLEGRGVSPQRINQVIETLQRNLNNNPYHLNNIELVKSLRTKYASELRRLRDEPVTGGRLPLRNQALFQDRVELPEAMVAQLGEYANATFSVLETAEYASRVLPRQNYFQNTLEVARRNGLIKPHEFYDEWGTHYRKIAEGDGVLGAYAGQYVHPHLLKELERMATVDKSLIPAAFNRVRSLITGGYLAAPSVLAANFVGGLYQGATAGIDPVTMLKRMHEVLPDMLAAARGEQTELMRKLMAHGDLDITGLVGSDKAADFSRLVRQDVGFGSEGVQRLFDNVTSWYEDFLQRPGLGRFRVPFAGLQGFQFTENWFKVAAFKEASERLAREGLPSATGRGVRKLTPLEIERTAAEFARTVVFDYSTLPSTLDAAKKYGLVLFPGFAYFLAGRTLNTALTRPGVLSVSDRLSEALMNAQLPIEDQLLAWLGMPDWLKEEQAVPLPFTAHEGREGNRQASFIPLAQLVPTVTLWDWAAGGGTGGNPWGESITQAGLWGPLFDVVSALFEGDGEATFTGRYGHQVFDPGTEGAEKAGQVFRFLYNTMAPSMVRKTLTADYQGRAQGLLPSLARGLRDITGNTPEDLVHGVYTINERATGRPDKRWQDQIVANFLRTPTVVAMEGPLAGIRDMYTKDRQRYTAERSALVQRYDRARAAGQTAAAEELRARINALSEEFNTKWAAYQDLYDAYVQQRRRERAQGGR